MLPLTIIKNLYVFKNGTQGILKARKILPINQLRFKLLISQPLLFLLDRII